MILTGFFFDVTPSPSPTAVEVSPTLGSPGLLGFIVTFAVAVGVVLLARSMAGHLRRVAHRASDEADGVVVPAQAERTAADGPEPGGSGTDVPTDAGEAEADGGPGHDQGTPA